MSVTSSPSLNITLSVPPPVHSISDFYQDCMRSMGAIVLYSLYTFMSLSLLLPLYIFVLYTGFQQQSNRRFGPSGQSMSHSDFFTFHSVILEIFGVLGSVFACLGTFTESQVLTLLGVCVFCIIFPGQTLFHCLTCVERYLAVVHPITYMHLRDTGGVRIRNISAVCVWLLCLGWVGVTHVYLPDFPFIPFLCLISVLVLIIFFCCLSVLCVLTYSRPGEVGGNKGQVDQSKQRAFHVICAISGVLVVRCFGLLISFGLYYLPSIRQDVLCVLMDLGLWFTVPSSLVLPLLFLNKTGKLACCRRNTESGQEVK